jgi:hypothetical protein
MTFGAAIRPHSMQLGTGASDCENSSICRHFIAQRRSNGYDPGDGNSIAESCRDRADDPYDRGAIRAHLQPERVSTSAGKFLFESAVTH